MSSKKREPPVIARRPHSRLLHRLLRPPRGISGQNPCSSPQGKVNIRPPPGVFRNLGLLEVSPFPPVSGDETPGRLLDQRFQALLG